MESRAALHWVNGGKGGENMVDDFDLDPIKAPSPLRERGWG
jgi:hypothetical protein